MNFKKDGPQTQSRDTGRSGWARGPQRRGAPPPPLLWGPRPAPLTLSLPSHGARRPVVREEAPASRTLPLAAAWPDLPPRGASSVGRTLAPQFHAGKFLLCLEVSNTRVVSSARLQPAPPARPSSVAGPFPGSPGTGLRCPHWPLPGGPCQGGRTPAPPRRQCAPPGGPAPTWQHPGPLWAPSSPRLPPAGKPGVIGGRGEGRGSGDVSGEGEDQQRKNHAARAPGSDINIFWKLPVHSGPTSPVCPQTRPFFLGCSSRARRVSRAVGRRVRGRGGGIRNGSIALRAEGRRQAAVLSSLAPRGLSPAPWEWGRGGGQAVGDRLGWGT